MKYFKMVFKFIGNFANKLWMDNYVNVNNVCMERFFIKGLVHFSVYATVFLLNRKIVKLISLGHFSSPFSAR